MTDKNSILLSLKDDGIGFNPKTISAGQGIANMKKRAAIIKAKIEFQSIENSGTQLLIRLPYGQ
jgi:signal transduction histidine kinase